jgi:hypothetical protein
VSASAGVEVPGEDMKEGDKDGEDDDEAQCVQRALEVGVKEVGDRGRLFKPLLAVVILEEAEEDNLL